MKATNFFNQHRKEIGAFAKGKNKDVDTACLMWLQEKGLKQADYVADLNEFMTEWRKRMSVSGEQASKWFRGEID